MAKFFMTLKGTTMIQRALAAFAVIALTIATVSAAQQRALPSIPQSLSLDDAVELAVRFNPGYRQFINDRGPARWAVRNAYGDFLPSVSASGGLGYSGSGAQTFAAQQFVQPSGTISSSYSLGLNWQLSGSTLMQPRLRKAQLNAAEAAEAGSRIGLRSLVAQQYLTVRQANEQVALADVQLKRSEEGYRLARARFDVGQGTILDVRQAEVARGQAEVGVLQAKNAVTVEKLRLFQQLGVPAPDDPSVVTLSDSFPIVQPTWELPTLLASAQAENPDLGALRAQESASRAGERAAKSSWFPTLSFSAGWAGYTQQYTNSDFLVTSARTEADANYQACLVQNQINTAVGITPLNCALFQFTTTQEQQIRDRNTSFPFNFTKQPFSARLTLSLPIFVQFSRPTQVSQAGAQTEDARERVRARELQVRTDVSQAYYGLQTAFQTVQIQQNNRAAGQEQLRLATERYRVGSGTFLELTDAQLVAQRAETEYVRAVYDYHRAIAALEAAVGRTLR
ncbi:MAG: TolC family protein [Gemmatimonadetes bacterium]|nr:TolC family protein [Gemmatimonadota bacterium]